jgi:hypothetical protein
MATGGAAVAIRSSRRHKLTVAGTITTTGIVLGVAYLPMLLRQFLLVDDEGVFLVSLRQLLHHHGSLYAGIWADKYGPFYYLLATSIYRVIGQQPSLENAAFIVLVITVATSMLFAAAVWRLTRSLACAILCEVASFLILIYYAGLELMHPGSLGVLLVAAVMFCLSSYAVTERNVWLFWLGLAVGALLLTKINVGLFVVIALVTVFVANNRDVPARLRLAVLVLVSASPFVLMLQRLSALWAGTFALIVAATIVGISMSVATDLVTIAKGALRSAVIGVLSVGVVSIAFALITGTPLHGLVTGVFIEPLRQAHELTFPAPVGVNWFTIVITVVTLYFALGRGNEATRWAQSGVGWWHAVLAVSGLVILGLAIVLSNPNTWNLGEWLPALAILPAAAIAGAAPAPVRFALRSFVLVAALQILVAYPVAGSQIAWATAATTVPCAVAIAAGIDRFRAWTTADWRIQVLTTASVCLALVVASALWPPAIWKQYNDNTKLALPGAGLFRLPAAEAQALQSITHDIRRNCDEFYSVPAINSLYIFTRIPPLTGLVGNYPGGLTVSQQRELVKQMREAARKGRFCIVRDTTRADLVAAGYATGPLHKQLRAYQTVIASDGPFTITVATP